MLEVSREEFDALAQDVAFLKEREQARTESEELVATLWDIWDKRNDQGNPQDVTRASETGCRSVDDHDAEMQPLVPARPS